MLASQSLKPRFGLNPYQIVVIELLIMSISRLYPILFGVLSTRMTADYLSKSLGRGSVLVFADVPYCTNEF
jgi:hypothetical protein